MSSPEEEEETFPAISQEEKDTRQERVNEIRTHILTWKKKVLNAMTRDNQDTLVLNEFRNELVSFFYLLRDVMEGYEPTPELESHEVWATIKDYFPLHDGIERIDLTHTLYRDLVEFPFTFNSKLINAFLKKNSLENAEILPNK
jgi:hypothetical protein